MRGWQLTGLARPSQGSGLKPDTTGMGKNSYRLFQSVRLVFPGRVKPQLPREGCRGLIRRIPARFYSVLQAIQYQGCRDSTGQPAAAKLRVGLNLDLEFSPANRSRGSAGDKPALMQDAHSDPSGYELF